MVSSIYNKVKLVKNSYLSKLELVNKFNLDQVDKVPFVDRVTVEFPISKFLTAFYGVKKYEYSLDVQIKFVLVVYLLVLNFPFINYKSIQSQEKVSYRNSGDVRNFSLKITLTGKDIIEKFFPLESNDICSHTSFTICGFTAKIITSKSKLFILSIAE